MESYLFHSIGVKPVLLFHWGLKKMEQEDLTHKIIGCAYKVYNRLGFGFLESIYPVK